MAAVSPSFPPGLPYGAPCSGSCFFISEYVEADVGSQNTFLELYNGCESAVTLSHYESADCELTRAQTERIPH